jgi:glycosyltransferase involved in cell wall biosynthesis
MDDSSSQQKSLKILHVIRSVDPAGGGPIEGLKQLARENIENGHVVHVVSLDDPNDPWVAACPVKCFAVGPCRWKYGFCPSLVTWLRARRLEYDIVIVNGIWQYHSYGVWRALKGTSTPYFVFTHGMLDPYFKKRYPFKHLKKSLYWPWAEYRVLRDAKAVLFTCEEEKRLARQSFRLYKVRELVVNYGVMEPPRAAAEQTESFLSAFPQLRNKTILLNLGRIHPKKGLELAVRAFGEIAKGVQVNGAEAHLVLAGPEDPGYAASLRAIVAELGVGKQITFTDMLTGNAKWGAFRTANAFLLPSYQENFGIAVVEALACGLPVFISDQVNIWREIEEDGAGVVRPATLDGTRELLRAWMELDGTKRDSMKQAAINSYRRRFNARAAAMSLIAATQIEQEAAT